MRVKNKMARQPKEGGGVTPVMQTIVDELGVVVHDPSPKSSFEGENIIGTGKIIYWYTFSKSEES